MAVKPIRIVSYDPRWPMRFESERAILEHALGEWVVGGIHHVGSTAIPGMDAKAVIDILVGVHDLESSRPCFAGLRALGYKYAPYKTEEMHWFCKPDRRHRTHHLHLKAFGSSEYRDELAFRDYLRSDADVARRYAALKHQLAQRFEHDREAYTAAKTDFIRGVLQRALAELGPKE
jgi:GrpB-like predicted nucleotidyltransferase (UPF0157 family)